jgi:uncharacterized protein (DUF2141 family)
VRTIFEFLAAVILMAACQISSASDANSGIITVHVNGFKSGKGHAIINLFREGQDVMKLKEAYRRATCGIENDQVTFSFTDLPAGNYAVSVFHDLNDNGELDHRMGFPAEPLGFSNGFHLSLFSGLPSFEKLRFPLRDKQVVVEIQLK